MGMVLMVVPQIPQYIRRVGIINAQNASTALNGSQHNFTQNVLNALNSSEHYFYTECSE